MKDAVRDLRAALDERRVLVVCGSGGVGKTTTSAALALHAARSGRRVLVCTIDPSRRLVTSLGLSRLSGSPRALDISRLDPRPGGALWAMMLDVKHTFDALVERYGGSPEACRRILDNTFYQQISSALAGSHEYMAMEKLLELRADPRFDLIVLDTPPTRHALDFLDAPRRMLDLLDTSILRWFLKPYFVAGRLTLKVATRTGAVALRLADRYLGLQFLQDFSEFCLAFEGMYAGFKERAARVHSLLRDASSGFVLVASPARSALEEALFFYRRLRESGMPFVAFVVNRVRPDPATLPAPPGSTKVGLAAELVERLVTVHHEQQAVARAERREVARLEVDAGEPLLLVPEMERDIHDLRGLQEVAAALFGSPAQDSRLRRATRAGATLGPGSR